MALKVWLPLDGSLENIGVSNVIPTGTAAFVTGGKTGTQCLSTTDNITIAVPSMAGSRIWSFAFWGYVVDSSITTNWTKIAHLADGSSNVRIEVCPSSYSNGIYCYSIHNNAGYAIFNGSIASPTGGYYDQWAHVCLTCDGTTITKYINGVQIGTIAYNGTGAITGTVVLTNNTAIRKNDVRIYDHCLSTKEVREIAQGLILHYKLNGVSGGSGKNIALKSNNGNFGSSDELLTKTFSGWDNYAQYDLNLTADEWNALVGKKVTYTCWINNIEQTTGTGTGIMIHFRYADGTYQQFGGGKNGTSGSYFAQGESGLARLTVTIPDPTARTNPTTITRVQYSVRHNSSDGAGTVEYQHAQVEIGDTPTAWSWAPEDFGIDTTKVTDSSGYGHDGIAVNSPQTVFDENSRYNICTQFNGSNTYINAGTAAKVKDAITIAWWGNMNSWSSYTRAISCTEGGGWNFEPSSGKLNFAMGTGASSNTYKSCTSNTTLASLSAGWHHFVGTYDGLVSNLYIDGVLDKTLTCYSTKTPIYYHASNSILVGAEVGGGSTPASNYFNGKLSDIRIYATALSADDVLDLYHTAANIDNLGGVHSFEFKEAETENLSNFSLVASNWVADGVTAAYTPEDDIVKMTPTSGNKRIYHNVFNLWTSGKTYLVSLWAKADSSGAVIRPSRSIADFATPNFNLTTDWKQYYGIINCTSTVTNGTLSISYSGSTNIACYVSHIKLEEANKNLDSIIQTGVFKENWIDETNFTTNAKILKNESVVIGREFIEK